MFELFSYTNGSAAASFPDENELWVKFYFRNGTPSENQLQSYSLFDLGPSLGEMTWTEFESQMSEIVVSDVGDWCTLCGAVNLFCQAFNSSQGDAAVRSWLDGTGAGSGGESGGNAMQPAVAGVIGAVVALGVAGLLFAAAMLVGGLRFHRRQGRKGSDLGGFKGGRKMASDQDLTIPKGGAVVGASVETGPASPSGGHERVGSWKLKQAEAGGKMSMSARPSMEQREPDPFQDPVRPVEPHERV